MSSASRHQSHPKIFSPISAKQKHLKVVFLIRKCCAIPNENATFPLTYHRDIVSPNKFRQYRMSASIQQTHRNASCGGMRLKVKGERKKQGNGNTKCTNLARECSKNLRRIQVPVHIFESACIHFHHDLEKGETKKENKILWFCIKLKFPTDARATSVTAVAGESRVEKLVRRTIARR